MARYYLADKKSEAHRLIEEMYKRRSQAHANRWELLGKWFPETNEKDNKFQVVSYSMGGWAVRFPDGYPVPPEWRETAKFSRVWVPRRSTKEQKALAKEMDDSKYIQPGPDSVMRKLKIQHAFVGFTMKSIGIVPVSGGKQFVLELEDGQKVPDGCKRITDVEFEKLTAKPKKSRKKTAAAV